MAYDYQLPNEDDILHTAQLRAGYPISRRDFDALMNASKELKVTIPLPFGDIALASIYRTVLPLLGKVFDSEEQP